jgi:signal transduction histidine kinase
LTISDTGSGMTPDVLSRIFDPFYTTKLSGRGLGLAAVQGIIRNHNGWINVSSAPGQGTRFEILLPCMTQTNVSAAGGR